jgi:hypothetical protein
MVCSASPAARGMTLLYSDQASLIFRSFSWRDSLTSLKDGLTGSGGLTSWKISWLTSMPIS